MRTRLLAFAFWLAAVGLILFLNFRFQGQTEVFRGIAETSEITVTTESAAEIAQVFVTQGQTVQAGDTLVRLKRPDLDLRLQQISRESQHVQGQTSASSSDIDRRVGEVRAALSTRSNQIRLEIRQLQDLRKRSQELAERLQVRPAPTSDSSQAVTLQIKALERELALAESSAQSQIALLQGSRGIQHSSGQAQASSLSEESRLISTEKARLVILATQTAVVGAINFHAGEKVNPFNPILTLMAPTPTLVRGYLQENVVSALRSGDSVKVVSTLEGSTVGGQVVGLGTRIVELPLRLRRIPTIAVWGREVTIRIAPQNRLLLGELVTIEPRFKGISR